MLDIVVCNNQCGSAGNPLLPQINMPTGLLLNLECADPKANSLSQMDAAARQNITFCKIPKEEWDFHCRDDHSRGFIFLAYFGWPGMTLSGFHTSQLHQSYDQKLTL